MRELAPQGYFNIIMPVTEPTLEELKNEVTPLMNPLILIWFDKKAGHAIEVN